MRGEKGFSVRHPFGHCLAMNFATNNRARRLARFALSAGRCCDRLRERRSDPGPPVGARTSSFMVGGGDWYASSASINARRSELRCSRYNSSKSSRTRSNVSPGWRCRRTSSSPGGGGTLLPILTTGPSLRYDQTGETGPAAWHAPRSNEPGRASQQPREQLGSTACRQRGLAR